MSESLWKKEIHLRKPKQPKALEQPKVDETMSQQSSESLRKGRGVRRRPEPLPPLPQHLLDSRRAPRDTVVVPVVPGRPSATERFAREFDEWAARAVKPPTEEQLPVTPDEDTLTEVDAVPVVETEPVTEKEPVTETEPRWPSPWEFKPAVEVDAAPDPEPELPWEPEPAASVPEFEFLSVTPPALMELGSAAPDVELAPEPNQVPEFAPQQEVKVPLLKREIHFRKPKAEPKELGSDATVSMLELPPEPNQVPEFAQQQEEKVSLLKREIHFRKPKAEKQPKAKKEPKEKTPLLKREIHFRKPKPEPDLSELHLEPAQELEVETTTAASVELVSDTPTVSDTASDPEPKELGSDVTIPMLELPSEPNQVPELSAPKEKVPLLKREMHFPKPKGKKTQKSSDDGSHKVTRVIGLRIGSSQISAAHVRNNGSAELVQLAQMPIEHGLVIGGEVRDADGLTRSLKEFFVKNKLPRKDVRLGIASNRIGVRILEVPAIDDPKQFKNALRFRAQELLPIPIVDAILDHVIIDSFVGPEGEDMRRVLLVFAHRELVSRFVDVCKGAGIRLAGIDLEPFALLRSVAAPRSESGDAIVAVSVGHDRTIVAVSDGHVCDFVRVLDWGGASLDVAIARALNLAPSQAEPLKYGLALDATEPPDGITPVQLELVKAAAKTEIASLGRELVSSLRFYQARPGSLAIGEVLLAGGGAQLEGFADELQRHLGAPVRVADPLARVNVPRKFKHPEHSSSLAVAIGLGIEN